MPRRSGGRRGRRMMLKTTTTLTLLAAAFALAASGCGGGSGGGTAKQRTTFHDPAGERVAGASRPAQPLSDGRITSWAYADFASPVRAAPHARAPVVTRLHLNTQEQAPEVYELLESLVDRYGIEWLKLRVPAHPHALSGWVTRLDMGRIRTVGTSLVISQRTLRAILYRDGRAVWSAPVGVGAAATPTPRGRFWAREKFHIVDDPAIGRFAFGTSAYSAVLTDWPHGGLVGIHGTSDPSSVPGRVSHGCVRLRDTDLAKLFRLMPRGTPIRIY